MGTEMGKPRSFDAVSQVPKSPRTMSPGPRKIALTPAGISAAAVALSSALWTSCGPRVRVCQIEFSSQVGTGAGYEPSYVKHSLNTRTQPFPYLTV